MKNNHIPLRRCVVCKKSKEKEDLIRVAKNKSGEISVDNEYKMEGRGTYICRNIECIEKSEKKNILNKFLNTQVDSKIYEDLKNKLK